MKKRFYRKRGGFVPFVPKNKTRRKDAPFGVPTYAAPNSRPSARGSRFRDLISGIRTQRQQQYDRTGAPKTQTQTQAQEEMKKRRVRPRVNTMGRKRPQYNTRRKRNGNGSTRIRPIGTGTTTSYFRKYSKLRSFRHRVEKVSPEQYRLRLRGQRLNGLSGKQCSFGYTVMAKSDLDEVSNNVPAYTDLTRVFIKNNKVEFIFTNQAKTNTYITIYEVRYRKSSNSSPRVAWQTGMADYAVAGLDHDTYGVTPFKAKLFTTLIKVDKVINVELGQGRSHKHISNYGYNKDFTRNEIVTGGNTFDYNEDWTRAVLFVAKGEPVNDAATKATVIPASVAIDFVIKDEIKYHYGDPSGSSMELDTTLSTIADNLLSVMDEGSGAAEVQEVA